MNLTVIRDTFTPNETVGCLQVGQLVFDYIEQPRNHDQPGHSSIPVGTYQLVPHVSGHLREKDGVTPLHTWALVNPDLGVFHYDADVPPGYSGEYPARTVCLMHPANLASELHGCGAPGIDRTKVGSGQWMVTDSRVAFEQIRDILGEGSTGHTIEISESN